jgi:protein-S-isoprenylcysteine O-methyltransferase Ste14
MSIETLQQHIARWRVPLGFLLGSVCLIFAAPRPWSLFTGAVLGLLGIFWRAWASGHLRKNERLATGGPYAYTRNPLYFGSFMLGAGFSIATGQVVLAALFIAFFILVYWPVMRAEASHMSRLFPLDYPAYAAAVPLFLPRLSPWKNSEHTSFDWHLYLRYREYRALLGMVAALGVLAAKIFIR